jgi:ABC-type oligopeptide transport system ATPase subunit
MNTNAQRASDAASAHLLEVCGLRTHFPIRGGAWRRVVDHHRAVDGVSFHVDRGETLGLVGESGCGKTTIGRTILRLVPATSGDVRFEGRSIFEQTRADERAFRRSAQIIFQDPAGSLNPRLRIGTIVGEPLKVHGIARGADLRKRVGELLERCGLWAAAADRYPHEFSGGQRQRIAIARALALRPKLIVCDEPTSALDVSVQAQILNLLADLQRDDGMAYLFISHDMGVINHICHRVAVMHDGHIVEQGDREQVIHRPEHPYTRSLLAAVPTLDPHRPMRTLAAAPAAS